MILRCYTGPVTHHLQGGRVRQFRPQGEVLVCMPDGSVVGAEDRKKNPVTKYSEGGLSARLFVGLSVGDKATYTIEDVIKATIEIRRSQKELPDATFLAQRGVYTARGVELVEEDSVQIVIIDVSGTPEEKFTEHMTELGEKLRAQFKQKEVILEVQRKGVVQAVYGIHE